MTDNRNFIKKSLFRIKTDLKAKADKNRARVLQSFFKTGAGEYGEGDAFLGIRVPELRKIAGRYECLPLSDVHALLLSKYHEERLTALLIIVLKFGRGNEKDKEKIYRFYLKNTPYINNWDLVDLSAPKIVGAYLFEREKSRLYRLAKSKMLWERRIAIVATFHFIKHGRLDETMKIARMLLRDEADLIHKAAGWMLREVGKRNFSVEENFLRKYFRIMPRTMLRYAIERFPETKRQSYLHKRTIHARHGYA